MRHRWLIAVVVMMGAILARGEITSISSPASRPAEATSQAASSASASSRATAVVVLKGEVDDYSRDALIKHCNQAKADGAKTIILVLNTPGGLVSAAMDITHYLRSQSSVHTIAFVDNMAYSAGIMIGLACDELVMSPESHIGDCAPIMFSNEGGLQSVGETERAKMESPILAEFYESSIRNGYDPLLTSSMVSLRVVVHYIQSPTGEKKFVNDKEYDALTAKGWKPVDGVPDPLDKADTLLTVNYALAQKIGLSKGTYDSPAAFASTRHLEIRETFAPDVGDKFIGILGSAWLRGILIVVLLQSIYLAFGHPGHGWPEATAAISLVLLVGVPLLTGYATWWEAIAILAGLGLLAVEIFVLPGHLLPGLAGAVLLLGGLVMTFVGTEPALPGVFPSLKGTWTSLEHGVMTVTAGLGVSLFLWIWLNRYLPKMPYFSRLILNATTGNVTMSADEAIIHGPAIGDVGIAVSDLRPGGSVKFITVAYPEGRIAAVVSDSGYVSAGTRVVVREAGGNRIVVRTAETAADSYNGSV